MAKRKKSSGYIPSLDGWRAIAVLSVMISHNEQWRIHGHSMLHYQLLGAGGVWIFFALSGILICSRILEEEEMLGRFQLKRFYVRRLFRIEPAAICYLVFIAALNFAGIIHEYWRFWFGGLFAYQNFLNFSSPAVAKHDLFTGQYWTLSLEEHFYILLSLFLFFVRKRRIAILSVACVVVLSAQQLATQFGLFSPTISRRTYWMIQFLMIPALVAMLLRMPSVKAWVQRYMRPWICLVSVLGLGALWVFLRHTLHLPIPSYHGNAHVALLYTCWIWIVASMTHPLSWTTRFLETKLMRYLGRLSYSLYLWHVVFFISGWPQMHVTFGPLVLLSKTPICYVAALVAAMGSYHWIEKPMIRLGHRLAPPATPGHEDLREPKPMPA